MLPIYRADVEYELEHDFVKLLLKLLVQLA